MTQDTTDTPTPTLKHTVVMVGMMGCGKTSVGRALAAHLGVPFLDSDHEIEIAANAKIAEIFDRDGEPFFRDREAEVISRLMDGPPCVLSTGGGAWLSERNRKTIAKGGVAVWLDADLDLLWERVRHKDTRPLLRTPDPYATLRELYQARLPFYKMAGLQVKSDPSYSVADMARHVANALKTRPDILEV